MSDMEQAVALDKVSKVKFVPTAVFSMVMGIVGLGLAWRKASYVAAMPPMVGEIIAAMGVGLFIVLLLVFLRRVLSFKEVVKAEFSHPLKGSFTATLTIAGFLVSEAISPYSQDLSHGIWLVSAVGHILLALMIIRTWVMTEVKVEMCCPAWFMPVVGAIIAPMTGYAHGYLDLGWFLLSVGLVFWFLLFALILYRLIFFGVLPPKMIPTLFILIAPPAVSFLAYVEVIGGVDIFARILYYTGIFMLLVVFSMGRIFVGIPFALTWWAFTFPLAAMTSAAFRFAQVTGSAAAEGTGMALLALTTLTVIMVSLRTIKAFFADKLFLPEG